MVDMCLEMFEFQWVATVLTYCRTEVTWIKLLILCIAIALHFFSKKDELVEEGCTSMV